MNRPYENRSNGGLGLAGPSTEVGICSVPCHTRTFDTGAADITAKAPIAIDPAKAARIITREDLRLRAVRVKLNAEGFSSGRGIRLGLRVRF